MYRDAFVDGVDEVIAVVARVVIGDETSVVGNRPTGDCGISLLWVD